MYPSYMMVCTAVILFACALRLYLKNEMGNSCLWITAVIQFVKLGNILHISLGSLSCATVLILSYTLPFFRITSIRAIQSVILMHKSPSRSSEIYSLPQSSHSPAIDFTVAAGVTGFITLWIQSTGLVHELIDSVFARDTPFMKELFAILSFYLMYVAFLLLAFYPFNSLRGLFMIASLIFAVLSTEYADPADGDYYQSIVASFQPHSATLHAPFFLIVSSVLCFLATASILPIKQRAMRVVYVVIFSFCASMALFGVSFADPISSIAAPNSILQSLILNYNWIHCFLIAVASTSLVLRIASSTIKRTAGRLFLFRVLFQ